LPGRARGWPPVCCYCCRSRKVCACSAEPHRVLAPPPHPAGGVVRAPAVSCSVFSPHWLEPEDWLLPDGLNTIAAVLNSPSTLTLLDCADWRYEGLFVLAVTQPLQMLATFGLVFVPCYWCDARDPAPARASLCGGACTVLAAVGDDPGPRSRVLRQLQVHKEGRRQRVVDGKRVPLFSGVLYLLAREHTD
jgi:hypothetical protein